MPTHSYDLRSRDRDQAPNWAVVYEDRMVGVVGVTFEHDHRVGVLVYGIHRDLKGRGLTTIAEAAVIREAFRRYPDLVRVRAHTDVDNMGSMRVLVHEGTLGKNQFAKGRFVDEAIFGLLRREWSAD